MTQYQQQKKQIRAILGEGSIDANLTLEQLAQELLNHICHNRQESEYPQVLSASVSVLHYFSLVSESKRQAVNTAFVGAKAFTIMAKLISQKKTVHQLLALFRHV